MTGLEDALAASDLEGALNAVPWMELENLQFEISPELQKLVDQSGVETAKAMLDQGIDLSFTVKNPRAILWAKNHAAELIQQNIMPSSQQAIRELIERSFVDGITAPDTARQIREHIGILPRHGRAVDKYRKGLYKKFQGFGYIDWKSQADRLAERYAQKLINYRSKNIARTETIRASNEGQQEAWEQAIDKDLIRESRFEREWIADQTELTCPICRSLDSERAPLRDGLFKCSYNEKYYKKPPDPHPSCRCGVGLVKKETE